MKIMVFDVSCNGHHMEYLHHIKTALDKHFTEYVLIVPDSFRQKGSMSDWCKKDEEKWDLINSDVIQQAEQSNPIMRKLRNTLILQKYVIKHKPDHLLLIDFPSVMPFMPFLIPWNLKISGIIYRIYFYEWETSSIVTKVKDVIESWLLAKSKNIYNAFVLNDSSAVAYYRKRYSSDKFKLLPDPIMDNGYQPRDIRQELGIGEAQKVFIQFGGLGVRKGTLTILDAIALLDGELCKNYVFIFAGKISDDIRNPFINGVNNLASKCRIIVEEGFLPYERLLDLCHTSDIVLLPYLNIAQSSGIFGYAAKLGKPVIGPAEGVLGKMIRRHPIGVAIRKLDSRKLAETISGIYVTYNKNTEYLSRHSIPVFQNVIINSFK